METNDVKRCFLISPIGEDGTPEHSLAEHVYDFLQYEVFGRHLPYVLAWAGNYAASGSLSKKMYDHIQYDDLAIALLDYDNPNVYYEMAIRHIRKKVCVNIISDTYQKDENRHRPFDTKDIPEIPFPHDAMLNYKADDEATVTRELLTFKRDLWQAIADGEREFVTPVSLISEYIPHKDLHRLFDEFRDLKEKLDEQGITSIANYVKGEDESFRKLAEKIGQAKGKLRVSLFAPQGLHSTQNKAKKAFFNALCSFGKDPNHTCKCIIRQDEEGLYSNELKDIAQRVGNGSMDLQTTPHNNKFELGTIDDTAAFLCFYDESDEHKIDSTLFITAEPVIHQIEKIYDQIWMDSTYEFTPWTVENGRVVSKKDKTLQFS